MKLTDEKIDCSLSKSIVNIRSVMQNSSDLIIKHGELLGNSIAVIMCEGLASTDTIAQLIYQPLNGLELSGKAAVTPEKLGAMLQSELLAAAEQKQVFSYGELATAIMSGFVIILTQGLDYGVSIGVQGYKSRSIDEPSTHVNLRGSREGFVEVIRTNLAMVRRRLKTPTLVFKMRKIGSRSNTDVCLCYLSDRADPAIVAEVEERLKRVELNTILEGSYIQPFLEEGGDAVFSQVGVTERPDTLCAKLYDGRIAVFVDGTPFVLYLPRLLTDNFQTIDDYTSRPAFATFLRWIRYFSFFLTLLLPGFYVAAASFMPDLFPPALLLNLAASVQTTPYPLLTETLLIFIMYEILREAGLRLPHNIGHAVSVIGGLVIGDVVVSAGLIGTPLLLIVAITAVCSFIIPDLYESTVLFRFGFIISGGLFGMLGLSLFAFILLIKLTSASCCGVPYTAPITPFTAHAMRDVLVRLGWRKLAKSDFEIQNMNGVSEVQK